MSLLLGLDDRSGNSGDMFRHTKWALVTTRTSTVAEMTLVWMCQRNKERFIWWMKRGWFHKVILNRRLQTFLLMSRLIYFTQTTFRHASAQFMHRPNKHQGYITQSEKTFIIVSHTAALNNQFIFVEIHFSLSQVCIPSPTVHGLAARASGWSWAGGKMGMWWLRLGLYDLPAKNTLFTQDHCQETLD